ncbi:MAG: polysaccharide biosynthesis/export family protein [Ferruginibacter sp.]|nr:polysaccharide biosynthesis/export family protein [Cytophagales bacterium]
MKHRFYASVALGWLVLLSSCGIYNQNIMFQTDQGVLPKGITLEAKRVAGNYVIRPDDYLVVRVFTNKGERITDPNDNFPAVPNPSNATVGGQQRYTFGQGAAAQPQSGVVGQQPGSSDAQQSQTTGLKNQSYLVQDNGHVNLPMVGLVKLEGVTLYQADSLLARVYNQYYEDCFVITRTLNRRVLLLGALGGYVVPMENERISLIEVLARHGGANNNARVNNIRLIRGDLQNPEVFLIDLSTIEGMRKSNLTLLPDDIIYVQPIRKTFFESVGDLTPVLSLLASLATVIIALRIRQ